MNFYDILELEQLKAIYAALQPTQDSILRIKQRQYADRFRTPLHQVVELEVDFILQALLEDQYPPSIVDEELEEILDKLYTIKDPQYSRMSAAEIEDLVDAVLNKELARAAKKKRPTQETIQADIKTADAKLVTQPKSGVMSFGDLEKIDSKAEINKGGFKD